MELNPETVKEAIEAATPGPWAYRPQQYDDWGYVRAPNQGDGWMPLICQAKMPTTEEDENAARRNATDPWGANARLVAMAPDLAAAYLRQAEALRLADVFAGKMAALANELSWDKKTRDISVRMQDALAAREAKP